MCWGYFLPWANRCPIDAEHQCILSHYLLSGAARQLQSDVVVLLHSWDIPLDAALLTDAFPLGSAVLPVARCAVWVPC